MGIFDGSRHSSVPLPSDSRTSTPATSGVQRRNLGRGLRDRTRLTDDVGFGVAAEQVDETADNFVVVDKEALTMAATITGSLHG